MLDGEIDNSTTDKKENTKLRKKNHLKFFLMSGGINKNYDFKIFDSVFHFIEIPDSNKV